MKKISAIVLALLLIVAAFAAFGAGAAGEKVAFSVKTVAEGDNLVVTWYVEFREGADVMNGGFDLVWSTDLTVVTAPKSVNAKSGGLGATVGNVTNNLVKVSFAASEAFDPDTYAIATATFKATPGLVGGTYVDVSKIEGGTAASMVDYKVENSIVGPIKPDAAVNVEVAAATTVTTTTTEAPVATTVAAPTAAPTTAPKTGATGAAGSIALISLVALAGAGIVAVSLKKHK